MSRGKNGEIDGFIEKFDECFGAGAAKMLHDWERDVKGNESATVHQLHPVSLYLSKGLHLCRLCSFSERYRRKNKRKKLTDATGERGQAPPAKKKARKQAV